MGRDEVGCVDPERIILIELSSTDAKMLDQFGWANQHDEWRRSPIEPVPAEVLARLRQHQ